MRPFPQNRRTALVGAHDALLDRLQVNADVGDGVHRLTLEVGEGHRLQAEGCQVARGKEGDHLAADAAGVLELLYREQHDKHMVIHDM